MGAAQPKLKTTVKRFDEQELSIRAIEILPELFQVRANLDKGWSLKYSKDYAAGASFPPVLVYRLPDGRIVLVDGFHRIDALMAIGEVSVRAQIREGTMHEALLAAIAMNTAQFHRGRPFGEDDLRHAAEMLFADPEAGKWSINKTANFLCEGRGNVRRWRIEWEIKNGIRTRDVYIDKNGRMMRTPKKKDEKPNICSHPRLSVRGENQDRFEACVGGEKIHLGTDIDRAGERLGTILEEKAREREQKRASLAWPNLADWFLTRGIRLEKIRAAFGVFGTIAARGFPGGVMVALDEITVDTLTKAVGSLTLIRRYANRPDVRLVVLCYLGGEPKKLVELARQEGVEFLTPEELVESLKGAEGS